MTIQNEETWLQDFRSFIDQESIFHRKLGIKQLLLKPYTKISFIPDEYSQIILKIGDFRKAFLYRARMSDMNVIIVMGTQGRGKTNIFKIFIELSKELKAPFTWKRNLYIGESTLIERKYLASRHKPGEIIINDEAEFEFRPNSTQTRDLMWTLSSGRDSGLHFVFCFPTKKDTPFEVWLAHANWLFWVTKRDQEGRRVKYRLYYKVTSDSPFHTPEFVEYPYIGARFWQPFLSQKSFDEYKRIKDTIYDEDVVDDWYDKKNKYRRQIKKRLKQQEKEELALKADKIIKGNLGMESKILELVLLEYPNYKIARDLKISEKKLINLIDEELLSDAKSKKK